MTRYGTARIDGGTRAFRQDGDEFRLLAAEDVGELLRVPMLFTDTGTPTSRDDVADLAPPVLLPGKFVCAGLNYLEHAREVGKEAPTYPTLFAKYPSAMVGANDPIIMPSPDVSSKVDWEAELVIVIGSRVRNADDAAAAAAIFGYTVMNDVSMRDWQRRTEEWLQGKNFDRTTPVGPVIVTADEFDPSEGHLVETWVGDRQVQKGRTDDLIFRPVDLIRYVTSFMTLEPGDLIATGTPAGVGAARTPPEFLSMGDEVVTAIEGIGELRNLCTYDGEVGP